MNKRGFAAIYIVYSFFLIFIMMMLSVLMINNYKSNFLTVLKNDIKEEVNNYHLEVNSEETNNLEE